MVDWLFEKSILFFFFFFPVCVNETSAGRDLQTYGFRVAKVNVAAVEFEDGSMLECLFDICSSSECIYNGTVTKLGCSGLYHLNL